MGSSNWGMRGEGHLQRLPVARADAAIQATVDVQHPAPARPPPARWVQRLRAGVAYSSSLPRLPRWARSASERGRRASSSGPAACRGPGLAATTRVSGSRLPTRPVSRARAARPCAIRPESRTVAAGPGHAGTLVRAGEYGPPSQRPRPWLPGRCWCPASACVADHRATSRPRIEAIPHGRRHARGRQRERIHVLHHRVAGQLASSSCRGSRLCSCPLLGRELHRVQRVLSHAPLPVPTSVADPRCTRERERQHAQVVGGAAGVARAASHQPPAPRHPGRRGRRTA